MTSERTIDTEEVLEDRLSEPTGPVIETMSRLPGDVVVLGVAGKMGPSLARMARRASDAAGIRRRVFGVARFSGGGEAALQAHGVETIRCDLLDEREVAKLPDAPLVVFMTGRKFGTGADTSATWAMNSYLPGLVCSKYRRSRIVAFSTGNVYGLTPVEQGGSREQDPPEPVGEYAMSCLGRERVFEFFSRTGDIPVALVRLNYACDLRYGVLCDLARRVWAREPIDLSMGYFNTIWQGDANALSLRAFEYAQSPPWVVNLTGAECLSVRAVATRMGELVGCPVQFLGQEAGTALLSNSQECLRRLGSPRVGAERLIEWVVHWVMKGGRSLGKPTHFEARDGKF